MFAIGISGNSDGTPALLNTESLVALGAFSLLVVIFAEGVDRNALVLT